jgi:Tetracyclin repressor-like, C-terminal domain
LRLPPDGDRGDQPPGASPDTVTDLVFGVFWYRMLTTREPFDERLADELVAVLAGPPPRAASPAQRGR